MLNGVYLFVMISLTVFFTGYLVVCSLGYLKPRFPTSYMSGFFSKLNPIN